MLTIYRRHGPRCPHTSRTYRRCKCPLWVQGSLKGETIRQTLNQTSWEAATSLVRDWEVNGKIGTGAAVPTIRESIEKFIADARARSLREPTIVLLKAVLVKSFLAWCDDKGYRYLSQLDIDRLRSTAAHGRTRRSLR
jgi:integrase/recombinase XerD